MALEEAMAAAPSMDAHRLQPGTKIGAWFTVLPSTLKRTDLED